MRYMLAYDMMETARNTNAWLGATARTMASYPAFAMSPPHDEDDGRLG